MERQLKRRSQQEWEKIVSDQALSGMNAKAYCLRESIGLANFYNWRRRFSEVVIPPDKVEKKKPSFINVGHIGGIGASSTIKNRLEIALNLGDWLRLSLWRG